jgi:hypothetical protein
LDFFIVALTNMHLKCGTDKLGEKRVIVSKLKIKEGRSVHLAKAGVERNRSVVQERRR